MVVAVVVAAVMVIVVVIMATVAVVVIRVVVIIVVVAIAVAIAVNVTIAIAMVLVLVRVPVHIVLVVREVRGDGGRWVETGVARKARQASTPPTMEAKAVTATTRMRAMSEWPQNGTRRRQDDSWH